MIIKRRYRMHRCNACRAKLQDYDFVRLGVGFMPKLQIFFDYLCPRCGHHGRYIIPADGAKTSLEALKILVTWIDDTDEKKTPQIDWDRLLSSDV